MVHAEMDGNMSFYIGPDKKGFRAEYTSDEGTQEKTFKVFSQAVEWVEQIKNEEIKKDEAERRKEET